MHVHRHGEDPYRWTILAIMGFLFFMTNFAEFQLAGVVGLLSSGLHLDPLEFALCAFAPFLVNFVFGIPVGMLADRLGTRVVGSVLLLISCVGIIGRAYDSSDFMSLFGWMFAFGFAMAFVNVLGAKILGTWFKPEQMPLAMGLFISSAGLGVGFGEATAALFSSLTGVFTFGWVLFTVSAGWFLVGFRTKPPGQPDAPPQRVIEFLGTAARNRHVWVAGVTALFLFAGVVATAGDLPGALVQLKRAGPVEAGLLGIPLGLGGALGCTIVPLILRRMPGIRVWLASVVVIGAALLLAALAVPFGPMTWICVLLGTFLTNGMLTLIVPLPIMLREIGTTYGGSAGGIVTLLQTGGGFFIPSFAVALIAGTNPRTTFAVIFALYLISAALVLVLPERGFRHTGPSVGAVEVL
ncbi:MAG TPA: MFS transporter [Steroidobacteraceae bacterium]|nr:MFS transporter [Steroidobacteraceae bacterium]